MSARALQGTRRFKWFAAAGLLTILIVAAVSGCSIPGLAVLAGRKDTVRSADAALKTVFADKEKTGDWRLAGFKPVVGKVSGQIPRGGPGNVWIDGTYETKVVRNGPDWIVSLTESWDAKDFRESHSPATGTLSLTWQVKVNAKTGQVTWLADMGTGDFPPQLVK